MGRNKGQYILKDSGKRIKFKSGFQRDITDDKPRYDLIPAELLKRLAELYSRGIKKYGENNWRLAESPEEINRFKESAWRHFIDWQNNWNQEEDHAMSTIWNIISYEWHIKHKNNDTRTTRRK